MEQAIRKMQAEIAIDDNRNAAIHETMRAGNSTELIVPTRAFIPTTPPEQHRMQFDEVLEMLPSIKEHFYTI
ncbi:hypothetical protein N7530_005462 [Penicillium desertorum]|uniref:Uncharacterized protein n=1 Tax=Penicillium desertorum TaxID=1303715 RepID=A0A9W9X058_9EURO|nr:hypothetical protein N7530_005462 [Penicillium desertorum]